MKRPVTFLIATALMLSDPVFEGEATRHGLAM